MRRTAALKPLLAERGFLRLYGVRVTSAAADGIFQAALASYVLFNPEKATTPAEAAAALAALALPYSLVGPFAGVFLDRWKRQRVLVAAQLVKTFLVVGVAVLVGSHRENVVFLAVTIGALSVNRFFLSALSAALPHVVPSPALVLANAVSTTSGTIATLIGAAIGGGLRIAVGADVTRLGAVVAMAGVGYLGSSAIAAGFGRETLGPDAPATSRLWGAVRTVVLGLAGALRHIAGRRRVAAGLGAVALHRFCFGIATLTILLLERNYFSGTHDVTQGLFGLGSVVAASGLGIVTSAFATPRATRRLGKTRWITAMLLAAGVAVAVFGLPFQRILLVAGAFVLGFSAQGVKITVDTIVQEDVADNFRGRAFSVYDMLYNATYVAAAAVCAAVVPTSGKSVAMMTSLAAGYLLAGTAFAWLTERRRFAAAPADAAPAADLARNPQV